MKFLTVYKLSLTPTLTIIYNLIQLLKLTKSVTQTYASLENYISEG